MSRRPCPLDPVCAGTVLLALILGLWTQACSGPGPVCQSRHKTICELGRVHWYDSCGKREELVGECECGCNPAFDGCRSPCRVAQPAATRPEAAAAVVEDAQVPVAAEAQGNRAVRFLAAASEGVVAVVYEDQQLAVIDARTGARRFLVPVGGVVSCAPVPGQGAILLGFADGRVRAYDSQLGRLLWEAFADGRSGDPWPASGSSGAADKAPSLAEGVKPLVAGTGEVVSSEKAPSMVSEAPPEPIPAPLTPAPATASALVLAPAPVPEAEPAEVPASPPNVAALVPGAKGTLQVNSEPYSQVFVDGVSVGMTPLVGIALDAGGHRVQMVNEDLGLAWEENIVIPPGQELRLARRFEKGYLHVFVKPYGEVSVDGKRLGETPLGPIPLFQGEHQLQVTSPRTGKKVSQKVQIQAGKKTEVKLDLQ